MLLTHLVFFKFFHGATASGTVTPPTPPRTETAAGRRIRRKIILRINGELQSVDNLEQVLEVLKAVKKDVPQTARVAAQEIIRTGQRIGDAKRRQESAIEIVDAPYSVRDMIQTRLDEVKRLFWLKVQAQIRELEDDDDVMAVL